MKRRSPRLRTQLALAMIAAILLAVLFGYIGLNLFARWQQQELIAMLDPAARRADDAMRAGRTAAAGDVEALYRQTLDNARAVDREQDRVLVILAALASMLGVGVGIGLATRLTRPIDAISAAARLIATGNLQARAEPRAPGAGEIRQLLDDFNSMAASLEAYDRDIREGSAAIAHELRTPLTILRGKLQGLLDGLFEANENTFAGLIEQVDILTRIVLDLHTLSLANTRGLELSCEESDIAGLVRLHLETLQPMIADAGLDLAVALEPARCRIDRRRIGQVIVALIDNVVVHAGDGGALRIETGMDGDVAVLRVLDRGPGVDAAAGERMFDRFWRGEPSRNRDHGGSGLGLAVVAAIISDHGGVVEQSAREGGGLVMSVRLPRRESHEDIDTCL